MKSRLWNIKDTIMNGDTIDIIISNFPATIVHTSTHLIRSIWFVSIWCFAIVGSPLIDSLLKIRNPTSFLPPFLPLVLMGVKGHQTSLFFLYHHPSIANQPQQGKQQSPNQLQQQQQLLQQLTNRPRLNQQQEQSLNQQKQQQQLLNQNQHQGQSVYNANQVIACLNHQLADSIVRAGITGALALHNNTNGTVTASLNQTFITNATNVLDSCIISRR